MDTNIHVDPELVRLRRMFSFHQLIFWKRELILRLWSARMTRSRRIVNLRASLDSFRNDVWTREVFAEMIAMERGVPGPFRNTNLQWLELQKVEFLWNSETCFATRPP